MIPVVFYAKRKTTAKFAIIMDIIGTEFVTECIILFNLCHRQLIYLQTTHRAVKWWSHALYGGSKL